MYTVDLSNVTTKDELHAVLRFSLPLPEYYGNNLDALYDSLCEAHARWEISIVHYAAIEEPLRSYFYDFKLTVEDAIASGANISVKWQAD